MNGLLTLCSQISNSLSSQTMKRKTKKGEEEPSDSGREGFAIVWVAMVVVAIALMPLLSLLVRCKKKRERTINKKGQT